MSWSDPVLREEHMRDVRPRQCSSISIRGIRVYIEALERGECPRIRMICRWVWCGIMETVQLNSTVTLLHNPIVVACLHHYHHQLTL